MSQQSSLRTAWLEAADGRLCVREQAKAWALREVWQDEGKPAYGMFTWIASRVKTTLNGKPVGPSPDRTSIREFFDKIDADGDWFPGKISGVKRGPKRILRGAKVTAIVAAAKRIKREGDDPTYGNVCLLYTSPSPRDKCRSRMPSSA